MSFVILWNFTSAFEGLSVRLCTVDKIKRARSVDQLRSMSR